MPQEETRSRFDVPWAGITVLLGLMLFSVFTYHVGTTRKNDLGLDSAMPNVTDLRQGEELRAEIARLQSEIVVLETAKADPHTHRPGSELFRDCPECGQQMERFVRTVIRRFVQEQQQATAKREQQQDTAKREQPVKPPTVRLPDGSGEAVEPKHEHP